MTRNKHRSNNNNNNNNKRTAAKVSADNAPRTPSGSAQEPVIPMAPIQAPVYVELPADDITSAASAVDLLTNLMKNASVSTGKKDKDDRLARAASEKVDSTSPAPVHLDLPADDKHSAAEDIDLITKLLNNASVSTGSEDADDRLSKAAPEKVESTSPEASSDDDNNKCHSKEEEEVSTLSGSGSDSEEIASAEHLFSGLSMDDTSSDTLLTPSGENPFSSDSHFSHLSLEEQLAELTKQEAQLAEDEAIFAKEKNAFKREQRKKEKEMKQERENLDKKMAQSQKEYDEVSEKLEKAEAEDAALTAEESELNYEEQELTAQEKELEEEQKNQQTKVNDLACNEILVVKLLEEAEAKKLELEARERTLDEALQMSKQVDELQQQHSYYIAQIKLEEKRKKDLELPLRRLQERYDDALAIKARLEHQLAKLKECARLLSIDSSPSQEVWCIVTEAEYEEFKRARTEKMRNKADLQQ